jgi:nicotinate-nucleotide adenylyltransferase
MPVRTGILGSAFNPPHKAHFTLADTARKHFRIQKMIFIPTSVPPHKQIAGDWDDATRSLLIRIASFSDKPGEIARRIREIPAISKDCSAFLQKYSSEYARYHDPDVTVSDIELQRPEISYTIDTVRTLLRSDPDYDLFLIIGMDQAAAFDTWKEWEELPKLVTVCAGNRPGFDDAPVRERYPFISIFSIPPSDVSSTLIREKFAKNQSIRGFVPNIIEEFLKLL